MGSERVPEGPKMAPKTLLGPCGPILAYLGGLAAQAQNFSKSFWAKKGQKNFPKKNFICIISTPKGSGTLKNPKLTL